VNPVSKVDSQLMRRPRQLASELAVGSQLAPLRSEFFTNVGRDPVWPWTMAALRPGDAAWPRLSFRSVPVGTRIGTR
jgi:hypothetical protein